MFADITKAYSYTAAVPSFQPLNITAGPALCAQSQSQSLGSGIESQDSETESQGSETASRSIRNPNTST